MLRISNKNQKKHLINLLYYLIIILLISAPFFLKGVNIVGSSMYPTIHNKDIILMRIILPKEQIQKGDIVSIQHDDDKIIKRIIGIPGDEISWKDGEVFVNNKKSIYNGKDYGYANLDAKDYKLKSDEYYILGDNRSISEDSSEYGPVKRKNIYQKYLFRIKSDF